MMIDKKKKMNLLVIGFRRSVKGSQKKKTNTRKLESCKHEGNGDTSCDWCTWNGSRRLGERTGRVRNWRMNLNYPDYSIKIGLNTDGKKAWRQLHKNAWMQEAAPQQSSSCTATNQPSQKLSKLDENITS